MASQKKKKRSADEYNAPAKVTAAEPTASDNGDGPTRAKKPATRSASRRNQKRPGQTSLSARSQWLILASIAGVLVLGLVITSFLSLRGGDGNVDYASWDLPLIGDVDPGPEDGRVKLADYRGKPLVVKFFNSECVDCASEYPWTIRLYADSDAAFGVVFVNVYETGDWRAFAEENQLDLFPIAEDIKGDARDGLFRDLGANRTIMPVTAYYDSDGELHRIAYEATGQTIFLAELSELGVVFDQEILAEVVPDDESADGGDASGSDEESGG